MSRRGFLLAVAVAACAVLAPVTACSRDGSGQVRFEDVTVHVQIADDLFERSRGLQGRDRLDPDEGMLFVWPDEGERIFEIKGVDYPLDLIFMDRTGEVVGLGVIDPDASTIASSSSPARSVLEVPAGFVKRHSISLGDDVVIEGID